MTKLTLDEMAQKIVREEVLCCVSSLIHNLSKLEAHLDYKEAQDADIDFDELRQVLVQDDWQEAAEDYIRKMDRDDLVSALEDAGVEEDEFKDLDDDKLREKLEAHLEEEDEWQDFCEANRIDPYTVEAYEHWVVTPWLARKLEEQGHMTGEVQGLTVWGRPTTGQVIYMDGVIQAIAKGLLDN